MNSKKEEALKYILVTLIILIASVIIITVFSAEDAGAAEPDIQSVHTVYSAYKNEKELKFLENKLELYSDSNSELDKAFTVFDETNEVVESSISSDYLCLKESEIRDFAALVTLECGNCSEECQLAVASVILNRMIANNASFHEVAYAPNQFSPASRITSTTPKELSLKCVRQVLKGGPTIPEYVCYFRSWYYFDWGDRYCNYTNIGDLYFSYDTRLKARLEAEEM